MQFHASTAMKLYFYREPSVLPCAYANTNLNPCPIGQWGKIVFVCTAKNILDADALAKKHGHDPLKLLLSSETCFTPIVDTSKLMWFMFFVKEAS